MKKVKLYLLLIIFGMLLRAPSLYAASNNGNSLLEALEGQEKNDIGYRSGYFDGYVNGVADFSGNVLWCPPQNVKAGQLSKIVANYLRAHPERLHKGAETLVIEALSGPFPCKR